MAANYLLVSVIYNKSGFPPARQVGSWAGKPSRLSPEDDPVGNSQIRLSREAESTYTL